MRPSLFRRPEGGGTALLTPPSGASQARAASSPIEGPGDSLHCRSSVITSAQVQALSISNQRMQSPQTDQWHGTTILTVRKGGVVAVGGDGQVSFGQTIVKANARKVRRLGKGEVIGGFAGATADAFTLFERLESKLEQYPGQLTRAAVELAKDWRTDRYLRRVGGVMVVPRQGGSLGLAGPR